MLAEGYTDSLTYDQIANDLVELLNKIRIDSIDVIGWSDGGIIGLLMGIRYPNKVKKIIVSGANISIDSTVVSQSAIAETRNEMENAKRMIKIGDKSKNWNVKRKLKKLENEYWT